MDEWAELPDGDAGALMRSATFTGLLDGMEAEAIEMAVNAAHDDHDARQQATMKVRLLREIRDTLAEKAAGRKNRPAPGRA